MSSPGVPVTRGVGAVRISVQQHHGRGHRNRGNDGPSDPGLDHVYWTAIFTVFDFVVPELTITGADPVTPAGIMTAVW